MKKKRLISLMLAGAMTVGVATMTGCDEGQTEAQKIEGMIINSDDCYVVLKINDTDVLHNGRVKYLRTGNVYMGLNSYEFDCGKTYTGNAQCFISTTIPTEEVYDTVCEDCLGEELGIN